MCLITLKRHTVQMQTKNNKTIRNPIVINRCTYPSADTEPERAKISIARCTTTVKRDRVYPKTGKNGHSSDNANNINTHRLQCNLKKKTERI